MFDLIPVSVSRLDGFMIGIFLILRRVTSTLFATMDPGNERSLLSLGVRETSPLSHCSSWLVAAFGSALYLVWWWWK